MPVTGPRFISFTLALAVAAGCSDKPWYAEGSLGNAEAADASGTEPGDDPEMLPCENVLSDSEAARRNVQPGDSTVNRLDVEANGGFSWNDAAVDAARLRQYLELVSQMTPPPTLIVAFEPAVMPSARREVADLLRSSLQCRPEGL